MAAEYRFVSATGLLRIADNANIPTVRGNADYEAFLLWQAAGGVPDPYVAPAASIPDIDNRQFWQQLANQGTVSQAAAIAAFGGTFPAAVNTFINGLPAGQQFGAKMFLAGARRIQRTNQVVTALATQLGWDGPTLDAFFNNAAQL